MPSILPWFLFLFRRQHLDNLIWTLCSGVPVMRAYVVVTLWPMANRWFPYVEWAEHPIYLGPVMFLVQLFRDLHFYCIHRLIHWPPLYRFHKLHHKSTNPAPWSGFAMHLVEHLPFYSSVLIHWIVPSNPLLIPYHLISQSFGALRDHTGFSKLSIGGVLTPHGQGPMACAGASKAYRRSNGSIWRRRHPRREYRTR